MADSENKHSFLGGLKKCWMNFLYILPALAITVTVFVLRDRLTHIISQVILAVVMFFILNPAVEKLESGGKVKRIVAILIVFLIAITVIVGAVVFVVPSIKDNIREIAESFPSIKEIIDSVGEKIDIFLKGKLSVSFDSMDFIEEKVSGVALRIVKPKNVLNVLKSLIDIVTASVITFYLLKDKEKAGNAVLSVFPYGLREFLTETYVEIEKIFKSFVSGQLIIALIIGSLETLGLWLIGAPYPLLLGIIGGISNLIPYFGPFIGAVPAVFAVFISSPFKALLVILLFVIVQQIDNSFISPKIIEGKLGIHPVATIIAVFIGGEFFGLKGMFLAVPVYAILRGLCLRVVDFATKSVAK